MIRLRVAYAPISFVRFTCFYAKVSEKSSKNVQCIKRLSVVVSVSALEQPFAVDSLGNKQKHPNNLSQTILHIDDTNKIV